MCCDTFVIVKMETNNDNTSKKRECTINFSKEVSHGKEEVRDLVNIVLEHIHIVENKETEAVTWKAKFGCLGYYRRKIQFQKW